MTLDEVLELVRQQSEQNLSMVNHHGLRLTDALVRPEVIQIIWRDVKNGRVTNETLNAWLVGRERSPDGSQLVLREDGEQFGLASKGFPLDRFPSLVGWYGSLVSAFMSM